MAKCQLSSNPKLAFEQFMKHVPPCTGGGDQFCPCGMASVQFNVRQELDEIERLSAERGAQDAELERRQAKIMRLRAALQRIAFGGNPKISDAEFAVLAVTLAREALRGADTSGEAPCPQIRLGDEPGERL